MKNIQKFKLTIIGTMALILTVGLNVRHALNNYGILENRLHVEVLAQANNTNKGKTTNGKTSDGKKREGPTGKSTVHCIITETTYTSGTDSSGNSSNWNASGSANANWGVFSGGVSGGYAAGNTSNSGSTTTTVKSAKKEFDAMMYYCPAQSESSCTPYDPCK